MKKLLLLSSLILSFSVFSNTVVYKIEKEEKGKNTEILNFKIHNNDKNYYHKKGIIEEETYPLIKHLKTGEIKKEYEILSLENYLEMRVFEDVFDFQFKSEKKQVNKENSIPKIIEQSASIQLDLKNVNKERKSILKVDDIEFFISEIEN